MTAGDAVEHRPLAHLRPATGWTNDPVGPLRWQGWTHLFHQANPAGGFWDRPHWGHLASRDLVRWEARPLALSPDDDGPDRDGCFSGCAVDADGTPTLLYTGVVGPVGPTQTQTTCVARAVDDTLDAWVKEPANPVTTAPPGLALRGFRDPFVWREAGVWHQLVGAGIDGSGGAVLHHTSVDLVDWRFTGAALTGAELAAAAVPGDAWTGTMWECPVLLRCPAGDVLFVNVHDDETTHHPVAIVGRFTAGRFTPRALQRFDAGPDVYAPCLLVEPSGRAVLWGWSWEAWSPRRQRAAGWAGVLTLPRVVDLDGDRVVVRPLPELARLRTDTLDATTVVEGDGVLALPGLAGDVLDVEVQVPTDVAGPVQLVLRCSPDDTERTVVGIDARTGRVWLDRDRASIDPEAAGGRFELQVPRPVGDHLDVRVVLDRSIVEVFAGGGSLTARIYPTRPDSLGVRLTGAGAGAISLRAWRLRSVWSADDQR